MLMLVNKTQVGDWLKKKLQIDQVEQAAWRFYPVSSSSLVTDFHKH